MTEQQILEYLKTVKDPEVPVIDVVELGVVRKVRCRDERVEIDITPTYSGCPAMKVMEREILDALKERGINDVHIRTVLYPAWTTDWMSEETRRKLQDYGIAPPEKVSGSDLNPLHYAEKKVACPYCAAEDTRLTSHFGSTACKALYYCNSCQQPFEHFKCI